MSAPGNDRLDGAGQEMHPADSTRGIMTSLERMALATRYLDRSEAAQYLTERGFRVSRNTLQKWATTGGGPVYRRFGRRAVYQAADLDEWAEKKLSAPGHTFKRGGKP